MELKLSWLPLSPLRKRSKRSKASSANSGDGNTSTATSSWPHQPRTLGKNAGPQTSLEATRSEHRSALERSTVL